MAEKLIPGIPHATRIAILQQTDEDGAGGSTSLKLEKSVLESVLQSDEARNEAVRTADRERPRAYTTIPTNVWPVLSQSFETENPLEPVRAIRKIKHQNAKKLLFLAHKNANLKSGARGLQARKDLKAAEAKLESTREM
jgi:hypothetical protein